MHTGHGKGRGRKGRGRGRKGKGRGLLPLQPLLPHPAWAPLHPLLLLLLAAQCVSRGSRGMCRRSGGRPGRSSRGACAMSSRGCSPDGASPDVDQAEFQGVAYQIQARIQIQVAHQILLPTLPALMSPS